MTKLATYDEVASVLAYEAETGNLIWKVARQKIQVGKVAGNFHPSIKYHRVYVNGRNYYASRVCWLLYYGEWPKGQIDHINLNKTDNRITNLRVATSSQNNANRSRNKKKKEDLPKGVHRSKNRFVAKICVNKKRIRLGSFTNPNDAHCAYVDAARKYFGEFARAA